MGSKLLKISMLIGFLGLAACSSNKKTNSNYSKSNQYQKISISQKTSTLERNYIGVKGYLIRPPMFLSDRQQTTFRRCDPVEISKFHRIKGQLVMDVKQNGFNYSIVGLDRKAFQKVKRGRLQELDQNFHKSIEYKKSSGRSLASANQKVCQGKIWPNMAAKDFLFVTGSPEEIRQGKGSYAGFAQWVYKGRFDKVSYYFRNGRLYSWRD